MKLIMLLVLLAGCVSGQTNFTQEDFKNSYYKKDMKISANGFKGSGTLVLPKTAAYNFEFESYGELDLFTFATCHREISKEEAGEKGIFGNKKKTKLTYSPNTMELVACPIDIGGYDAEKGRHSWGFVSIETDKHQLPANVQCNGDTYNSRGTTICQSKVGLVQSLQFENDVVFVLDKACADMTVTYKDKLFTFVMPRGTCVNYFKEKAAPSRIHELTTFGYERILIRKI